MSQRPAVGNDLTQIDGPDIQHLTHTIPADQAELRVHGELNKEEKRATSLQNVSQEEEVADPHSDISHSVKRKRLAATKSGNEAGTTAHPITPGVKGTHLSKSRLDDATTSPPESGATGTSVLANLTQLPTRPSNRLHYERHKKDQEGDRRHWAQPILGLPRALAHHPEALNTQESSTKPWTGDDIEDQLDENVIKDGFSSKTRVNNECSSAKSSLLPHLKNGDGVHILSQVFLSAFKEQDASNRVTSLSCFKPPPRVTLTDARKTVWFSDLSNSLVPIRRLSKTIPHGIRGKVLLDQCLTNKIPSSRAIWLAKCVGANELRAFRRKGISGLVTSENETKWIQSWTLCVTEFLWELTQTQKPFDEMSYGLHLVSCLFAEQLLDSAQFFDDILQRFEESDEDSFVSILGIVWIWHRELLHNFRHAYRLAWFSVLKIKQIQCLQQQDVRQPIWNQLQTILRFTLEKAPLAFCCPSKWDDYTYTTLKRLACPNDGYSLQIIDGIRSMVEIAQDSLEDDPRGPEHQVDSLISFLDSLTTQDDADSLVDWVKAHDIGIGVHIIMRWASSVFRSGSGSCFIAVNLLEKLEDKREIVTEAILSGLFRCASDSATSSDRLAKLGRQLMRSCLLDPKAYIYTLVTSGASNGDSHSQEPPSCHALILNDIPGHKLSGHLLELRSQLLRRFGWPSIAESEVYHKGKMDLSNLSVQLPSLSGINVGEKAMQPEDNSTSTSEAAQIINIALEGSSASLLTGRSLSSEELKAICITLEERDEFPAFVPVLKPIVHSGTYETLIPVAYLIKSCEKPLRLAAQFYMLYGLLLSRYRALRRRQPPCKDLATCLLSLHDSEPWSRRYLENEILSFEQSQDLAANTPASDFSGNDSTMTMTGIETRYRPTKQENRNADPQQDLESSIHRLDANGYDSTEARKEAMTLLEGLLVQRHLHILDVPPHVRRYQLSLEGILRLLVLLLNDQEESHSVIVAKTKLLCHSNTLRSMLVDAIISDQSRCQQLFNDLITTNLSATAITCLDRMLCILMDPTRDFELPQKPYEPALEADSSLHEASLLGYLDIIINNSDAFATKILQFGTGVLLKAWELRSLCNRNEVQLAILQRIEKAVEDGQGRTVHALAYLPQSLNIFEELSDLVNMALLDKLQPSGSGKNLRFTRLTFSQLLYVARIAKSHSRTEKKESAPTASRIVSAFEYCLAEDNANFVRNIEACMALSLLHYDCFTKESDRVALMTCLCRAVVSKHASFSSKTIPLAFSSVAAFVPNLLQSTLDIVYSSLPDHVLNDEHIQFLLGCRRPKRELHLQTRGSPSDGLSSSSQALSAFNLAAEDPTEPSPSQHPYELRQWELLLGSGSKDGENDTPLGLRLFNARRT